MTERLTNLATSTLASPITSTGAAAVTVASGTRFPTQGDYRIRVTSANGSELMLVTTTRSGGALGTVTAPNRGSGGTTAVQHPLPAEVRHVITVEGLDQRVLESIQGQRGAANGVASLVGGVIPGAQLPASVVEYKGAWNATDNNPPLTNAGGSLGDQYSIVVTGGGTFTRNLGAPGSAVDWTSGNMMIHNGSVFEETGAPGSGIAGVNQIGLRTGSPLTGNVAANALVSGLDLAISDIDGGATTLANALALKADDTDLAAKADNADLTIIGPRKSLNNLGTPYLLGTDSTGTPPGTYQATDIGCVFDSSVDSVLRIPLHSAEPYPETSWFVARNIGNNIGLTLRVEMASTGTGIGIQTPLQVGTNPNSVEIPANGSCQFVKRATGGDIWMASGDHEL